MPLVTYEQSRECSVVRLNRPEKLNALSDALLDELEATLSIAEHDSTRILILTGCDRAFSVGSDLREAQGDRSGRIKRMHDLVLRLRHSPKLTVAALSGYVLGGGLELSLGCLFRVADRSATFGLPEIKLSVMPCYGGTQLLPRLVGESRALEMMLSGKSIDAEEALRWGLIQMVTPQGALMDLAIEFGLQRASGSGTAARAIRRAVLVSEDDLRAGLALEHELAMEVLGSTEAKLGVSSFRRQRGCPTVKPID